MKATKDRLLFLGILSILIFLGITSQQWLPQLLSFIAPNTSLIQGLASFIQILIWTGALLLFLKELYFGSNDGSSKENTSTRDKSSTPKKTEPSHGKGKSDNFSVNAKHINTLIQGEKNQTTINFNDSSTNPKDK